MQSRTWMPKRADLADGGEAVGQAVVGLLDGDGLLLQKRLHDPVGIIVGQVAPEKCRWVSMRPGMTVLPVASMTSKPSGASS